VGIKGVRIKSFSGSALVVQLRNKYQLELTTADQSAVRLLPVCLPIATRAGGG